MNIITVTSLFPNSKEPNRGIFTLKLIERLKVNLTVIAPVPWFPFVTKNRIRNVPFKEKISGITVYHPRFLSVPFLFKSLDSLFFYQCINRFRDMVDSCDLIYSSYGYPDGVGAYYLAKKSDKPFCITLHRGDIVYWGNRFLIKNQLSDMITHADSVIIVSHAIKEFIDCRANQIEIVPNGVDTDVFIPYKKEAVRKQLGLDLHKKIFLTVGNSFRRKGYFELVQSFNRLDIENKLLLIAGYDKNEYDNLNKLISSLSAENTVRLLGEIDNRHLPQYYSAADVYCLVSYSEGWPCSVMEALSCGIPCVVTKESAGEFITKDLGIVTDYRNLTQALASAADKQWDVQKILSFAKDNSWDKAAGKMHEIFNRCMVSHSAVK